MSASPQSPSFRRRIAHPALRELYDYWLAARGDGIAMPRSRLDPTDIPRLLPFLILADVIDGGRQIRYRVVGTEIVAAYGIDYTGKRMDELTGRDNLAYMRQLYQPVIDRGLPVYSEGRFRWPDREYRRVKRLHVPLTRDGTAVDMVLTARMFEPDQGPAEVMLVAEPDEIAADLAALGDPPASA